jgi:hypothetical protein
MSHTDSDSPNTVSVSPTMLKIVNRLNVPRHDATLTDGSAAAGQIVATIRHVRHLLRHRGTSSDTLTFLNFFPGYDSVTFRSRRSVRIPTRAVDFRFRKVNFERTNPFVAPNRCA